MTKLKMILGAFFVGVFFATGAMADPYASAAYQFQNGRDGQADANGMRFIVGNNFNKNWSAEVAGETMRSEGTKTISTLAEAAVIPSIPVGSTASVYLRAATGMAYVSGADGFGYYSLEPGVKLALSDSTGIKLGYRFRDSYDDNKSFKTNTVRLGLEQALTKNVAGFLGYDRSSGDSKYDAALVGLNVKF